jgi:biotin-dependent carboxylase-like uncharacterized protein
MTCPVLHVIDPGPLLTVQDRGRFGFEAMGIPRGGAMDLFAYDWANRLALNSEDAAVLEMMLLGAKLTPSKDCWLATTGAEGVTVDGVERPGWAGFWVRAGSTLAVRRPTGARAYVAVNGGVQAEPVLGSRSTDLESGFGGFEGRALRRGDAVPVGRSEVPHGRHLILRHPRPPRLQRPLVANVVPGPREAEFERGALETLLESTYTVSPQSNHMGLRLDGQRIPAPPRGGRISEPMPVGGVQITPAGQPIVLLNSRGTIGGYPLLATLITESVWRMGQARPGDQIVFRCITIDEAQAMRRALAGAEREPVLYPL